MIDQVRLPELTPAEIRERIGALFRDYAAPGKEPAALWADLAAPTHNRSIYDRLWRYEIEPADRYPAFRGIDTPATRAMRFAYDFAKPWYLFFHLKTADARPSDQDRTEFQDPLLRRFNETLGDRQAAYELLDAMQARNDIGTHLVYAGLRAGDPNAATAGAGLMQEAGERTIRLLARPGDYVSRGFAEEYKAAVRAASGLAGGQHLHPIREAASAGAAGRFFARLAEERPANAEGHPLQDALWTIHDRAFVQVKDGPYREFRHTLERRRETDRKPAALELRETVRLLGRLSEEAGAAAEDPELRSEYLETREGEQLSRWLDGRVDRLIRERKPPLTLAWRLLLKQALRNFRRPENAEAGRRRSLNWGLRQNLYLLPLLRQEPAMLERLGHQAGVGRTAPDKEV